MEEQVDQNLERTFRLTARRVAERLDRYLVPLRELADAVATTAEAAEGPLSEALLDPLRPQIESVVRAGDVVVGHGFVAAPQVVDGRERYLLWLQQRQGQVRRLNLNFDPEDVDVYDYLTMEWYTAARNRLVPVVFGPWVDYFGSDAFVFTVTVPVVAGGDFIGVAGADLLASKVESQLVPDLTGIGGDVVIVNADRAVVATNSARWMPGERMQRYPAADPEAYLDVVPLGEWTGWVMALGVPE